MGGGDRVAVVVLGPGELAVVLVDLVLRLHGLGGLEGALGGPVIRKVRLQRRPAAVEGVGVPSRGRDCQ